jgi:hypothetical protein
LITALAIWLQRDLLTEQVKSWAEQITRVPAAPELSSANKAEPDLPPPPIEREPPLPPPPAAKPKPRAPEPSPPPPPENVDEGNSASADPLSGEETTPEVKSPAQRSPARPENGDQGSRAEPVERRNKQLEAAVEHAIRIRAIDGVEVSVVNGTAVLSGRVASERQKQAAERAANSVSGVQRVRNRIVVG